MCDSRDPLAMQDESISQTKANESMGNTWPNFLQKLLDRVFFLVLHHRELGICVWARSSPPAVFVKQAALEHRLGHLFITVCGCSHALA